MAVANLKTILRSGRTVGGVVASTQFPQEQKEYLLRPTVASYPSVWDTVEKQASQSTPICVRPVNVLPETRRIETRSKSGWKYKHAPPYNLVVPAAYPEALNMNLPEHSWAQALQVALHSLRLAFHNVAGYAPISIEKAAERLHSIRRVHRLTMIPPSDYYLAKCRTLHKAPASGPTAVSGWK